MNSESSIEQLGACRMIGLLPLRVNEITPFWQWLGIGRRADSLANENVWVRRIYVFTFS
jgi:hypothetical protein